MFNDTHEERPYPQLKTIVKINDCMKLHKFRNTELRRNLHYLMASYQSKAKFSSFEQVTHHGELGPGPVG